jgi:hypothetical protein
MEGLYKLSVKVFAKQGREIPRFDFVPVLQRWIQKHSVPGVLIDVADYSHMHDGPGVILVAHEHNISIDDVGGRMGLLFAQKHPIDGGVHDTLRLCIKYGLMACEELQNEPGFKGRLAFDGGNLLVVANDRLRVPHDADSIASFEEIVRQVVAPIFDGDVRLDVKRDDARDRAAIEVKAANSPKLKDLIAQCTAQQVS